jgi:hypothetical protein
MQATNPGIAAIGNRIRLGETKPNRFFELTQNNPSNSEETIDANIQRSARVSQGDELQA